jgi:FemAB-related protein (PEP-CTERM system-associated)
MINTDYKPIKVGLDPSLAPWSAEVKYVFRTLFRIAGYPCEFTWSGERNNGNSVDIYYGMRSANLTAPISIESCGIDLTERSRLVPTGMREQDGLAFLDFAEKRNGAYHLSKEGLRFSNDIISACYWLLTGVPESDYARDRWDNLHLKGTFFLENALAARPLVSIYGFMLRKHLAQLGYAPLVPPWITPEANAAFVLSHDVDYPQMIRWIECLRLLRKRGLKSFSSISGVLRGTNNFWKFSDWVEFEKRLGVRPSFYFMARQGSLLQFAMGTPDGFYDVRAPEFRQLFRYLKDEDCEIGLHASYHAYRSVEQLRREKEVLEEAAGVAVEGNRHHYWHLDPAAPHETLLKHEQAGFLYDSSLALEFYPGFRRGICHPFRVFHQVERRELKIVELPPAWMDDHFDRRLLYNEIADPDAYASDLVKAAQASNGVIVVDYHPRGMNSDFYPRYGPWLVKFIENCLDSSICFQTPSQIVRKYAEYESLLTSHSRDLTEPVDPVRLSGAQVSQPAADEPIEVGLLQAKEHEQWGSYAQSHPRGSIYHTLAWKTVTEEGLGHKAYYLRALDKSGRITGILPLFLVKGIFGRRLVSLPMRDRGGVLADDGRIASLLIAQASRMTRELGCKYAEFRSLEEIDPRALSEHELHCERHWITTRIDLSIGVERLWKNLDKDAVRWAVKKAGKLGLRVEMDNTQEGVETFYELFVRTRRAMGIPPFPKNLFLSIWRHLISQGKANLFLVWKDAEPVNGLISLLSKDTFIPAYAAPQNRWRKHYLNELLIWHSIEWATCQGYSSYDFGADSPRQTGLLQFKRKWGGIQHPMFYYYFLNGSDSPPSFDSSAPTYSLARKVWSRLPVPVCKRLGSLVTRQLS